MRPHLLSAASMSEAKFARFYDLPSRPESIDASSCIQAAIEAKELGNQSFSRQRSRGLSDGRHNTQKTFNYMQWPVSSRPPRAAHSMYLYLFGYMSNISSCSRGMYSIFTPYVGQYGSRINASRTSLADVGMYCAGSGLRKVDNPRRIPRLTLIHRFPTKQL